MIETVTSSGLATLKEIPSCPSGGGPGGVNCVVILTSWMTVGVCFRRWVMKNAAKQATRRSAKTICASGSVRAAGARAAPRRGGPGVCCAQAPPSSAKRSTVSDRSPSRSVSSEITSSGAMLPRLHSEPEPRQEPDLLLALGRLEDQPVRVDRVDYLVDQARADLTGRHGRYRPCRTRAPRRSPSRPPPAGPVRSARPTRTGP